MTLAEQELRSYFAGMAGGSCFIEWVLGWGARQVAQAKRETWQEAEDYLRSSAYARKSVVQEFHRRAQETT